MSKELYDDRHFEPLPEEQLFEVRQFLGRTVYIIDNVIQPDFTLSDDDV